MEPSRFMTAIIRMPVEIFADETYKIYTDLYKIDFADSLDDPELLKAFLENLDLEEEPDAEPPLESKTPLVEKITTILAKEIKPRQTRMSTNTTFKHHRKSNMRFSRKQQDPIHIISSNAEDADSVEEKMPLA